MLKASNRIALLAIAGLMATTPVFAAPNGNNNNNNSSSTQPTTNGSPIDCSLPINANLKFCQDLLKNRGPMGGGQGQTTTGGQTTTNGNTKNNDNSNGNKGSNGYKGPNGPNGSGGQNYNGPKPGSFNFNQHDRSQFHQRFNGFSFGNFSFFFTPNFSITIGTNVPSTYHRHLKPVPASIYRYYPWFRGYDYFVDRKGDFVIVSPRTYRIVAVL